MQSNSTQYISAGHQPPVPWMELGGFPGDPPRQLRFFNRGTVAAAAAYGLMLARSAANTENRAVGVESVVDMGFIPRASLVSRCPTTFPSL
jgi:hypothetical protein